MVGAKCPIWLLISAPGDEIVTDPLMLALPMLEGVRYIFFTRLVVTF